MKLLYVSITFFRLIEKKSYALIIVFAILLPITTFAQSPVRIGTHNNIGWYGLYGDIKLSPKFSLSMEYAWRRNDFITSWQQSQPRIGINYKWTDNIEAQVGYAYAFSFPFGQYPNFTTTPEHRAYGQLVLKTKIKTVEFSNRLRYENRHIAQQNKATGDQVLGWNTLHRFRYEIKATIPLKKVSDAKKPMPYLTLYDEVFIGTGENVKYNIFDQNRIGIVFGYRFSPMLKAEVGYINQTAMQGSLVNNQEVIQYNNGIQVNLRLSADWSKKKNKAVGSKDIKNTPAPTSNPPYKSYPKPGRF